MPAAEKYPFPRYLDIPILSITPEIRRAEYAVLYGGKPDKFLTYRPLTGESQ